MTRIDTLRRQVEQILASIPTPAPTSDVPIVWLKDVSDEELDHLHAMVLERVEMGGTLDDFDIVGWRTSHPIVSREEQTAAFLSIDIDAVPDALMPGYPISRTGYNNMLVNHLTREKYDASTREYLRAWYQWRTQVQV